MGGQVATRVPQRAADDWSTDQDFTTLYHARLSHLVGMFRGKGITHDEALDLAHETVLRTLVHLKRHGRTREDIGPLTRTIARNLLIERIRRSTPHVVALEEGMDAPDDAPDPSELAMQRERRDAVHAALATLQPRHRRVIELWMQGRTPVEIARELGIKRNAADAILHRARRTLASRLGPGALWSGVVLAWVRLKTQTKSAMHTVSSWNPDSVTLAPAGVSLATVGIAAVLSLSGGNNAPAPSTELRDSVPVASAEAEAPTPVDRETASRAVEVPSIPPIVSDAPVYKVNSVGPTLDNPATDGQEESLVDLSYDPDKHGEGPLDGLLEPAFESCALTGACQTEAPR